MHGEELARKLNEVINPQVWDWPIIAEFGTQHNFSAEQIADIVVLAKQIAILAVMEYDHIVHSDDKQSV